MTAQRASSQHRPAILKIFRQVKWRASEYEMKVASAIRLFLIVAIGSVASQSAASRLALVIGNDSYQSIAKLRNARADAAAIADAFRGAGYDVSLTTDRTQRQMLDDVVAFQARVRGGDEVVFFFSGHGVQIGPMNYLLPIDVRSDTEAQVRNDGVALSRVLEEIREKQPALTLAIIDACRDNPFKGNGRSIGGRGLTGVAGASGQMVIYSAGEGQQALDTLGAKDTAKNGLFTRSFLREMQTPGVAVRDVLFNVREDVVRLAKSVNHEQVPAIYDQVVGRYYFRPATLRPEVSVEPAQPPQMSASSAARPGAIAPASVATAAVAASLRWVGFYACAAKPGSKRNPGAFESAVTATIDGNVISFRRATAQYEEFVIGTVTAGGEFTANGEGKRVGESEHWQTTVKGKLSGAAPATRLRGSVMMFWRTKLDRECTFDLKREP